MPCGIAMVVALVELLDLVHAACPSCVAPSWSWDTLAYFVHTAEGADFQTPDLEAIKKASILTVEKWEECNLNCSKSPPHVGSGCGHTDEKIVRQCKLVKSVSPSTTCLMYHDTNTVWDCLSGNCSGRGTDNIQYAYAKMANENPERYLLYGNDSHHPPGQLYRSSYVNATVIDFRKKAGSQLWIEACVNATRSTFVDGCFVDFCGWGLPEDEYPSFTEAHNKAMKDLTDAIAPHGVTMGNNCGPGAAPGHGTNPNPSTMGLTNGVFIEQFRVGSPQDAAASWERLVQYTTHPSQPYVEVHIGCAGPQADPEGCNSTLAAVLVLTREGVYVGDGSWGGAPESRYWPEFTYPLGAPRAVAAYDGRCGWTRSFASGTTARYNNCTGVGTISWAKKVATQRRLLESEEP